MEKRWIAFLALSAVAYLLYYQHLSKKVEAYKAEQARISAEQSASAAGPDGVAVADDSDTSPTAPVRRPELTAADTSETSPDEAEPAEPTETLASAPRTTVETRTMRVVFSHLGGKPVSWELLPNEVVINKSAENPDRQYPLELIPQVGDLERREYPFELVGGRTNRFNTMMFDAELSESNGTRVLRLASVASLDGLRIVKTFRFPQDGYAVRAEVEYLNESEAGFRLAGNGIGLGTGWFGGFGNPEVADRVHGREMAVAAVGGQLLSKSLSADSAPLEYSGAIGWVGVDRKFFAALLVPDADQQLVVARSYVSPKNFSEEYRVRGVPPPHSVEVLAANRVLEAASSLTLGYNLFVGPLSLDVLKASPITVAEGVAPLTEAAFHTLPWGFGWVRPVSLVLLDLLLWLQDSIVNWGLCIILLTVLVKTAVYPLTHWAMKNQARTMYEQQKIKPEMDKVMKKFDKDPRARNLAVMELYREHGVSPLGPLRGCLPMLMQMPIFVGLYVLFDQAVELRGQEFLWISDLSQPDRLFSWGFSLPMLGAYFNILPILMALTQWLSMRMMQMPSSDEMQQQIQKQMMTLMPIFFGFLLYQMPSGLMLYWVVSNTWAIGQSYATKKIVAKHQQEMERREQAKAAPPPAARPAGRGSR
ncbi:MAG: membrane protein insertase YidC [Candidatus Sumerlaeia bacterium]|nr:membrane protein insertase YidC [Candidatus Sumerlaeia bacterium]